jgi:NAD-dependent deacetylase
MDPNPARPAIAPELVRRLRAAKAVAALTGAGISAESGVPTFREAQTGLWAKFDPLQLATPEAFARDPGTVWEWYVWRRTLVARARPNPGHLALARLERRIPDFLLATQNVDGLHQQAGSRRLVELHGNLFRTVCFAHRHEAAADADGKSVDGPSAGAGAAAPPRCARCGSPLRPDVVWFGEMLPADALARAQEAAARCAVFLSIGTSSEVYPAAALPDIARSAGATVVEVNPQRTPLSDCADFALRGPAGEVLPALIDAAFGPDR